MSSNMLKAMKNATLKLHNVGNLNDWDKDSLNQGALAVGDMDNFTLVKLGFSNNGERVAEQINNNAEVGHLVASPEDYMEQYETISSFYNGGGERVRIIYLNECVRFECSNFEKADEARPIANGQNVHYDATKTKFIISNGAGGNHADYDAAVNKFIVVDANPAMLDGKQLVRFEVVK